METLTRERKIRILLADDHTVIRRGLRLLLESQPEFSVVAEAADGRQAVEQPKPPSRMSWCWISPCPT